MNETLLQYWGRVKQYWNKFNRSQKITFIATVVLLIVTIILVSAKMSKTEYEIAFTDLPPSDAKAIKDYLDNAKIPYQISSDGKSIGVAKNEVTNVRLDVVSQGLNKTGSIGYGAFSKDSPFGMTDNEFKVKHLDAVQGEIQQMIDSNVAVATSKVMIYMPEDSVFLQKDPKSNQSSASVVVTLKSGYTLDQQKIDTMYDLISKSIKNLPRENITISDQYGDLLPYSKSGSGSSAATIANQFEIKKQFEQEIYSKVQRILGGVLGPGKVVPMVVATLNFDKKTSKQQLVTPVNTVDQKGIEISVQKIQKSYTNDGSTSGGVAGTGASDVPTYQATTGSGKNTSEELTETVNYEVNRITNDIESSPYIVTDLTISVGVEPPDRNNPTSLTQDTMDAIQKLLTNVVSVSLADSGKTYTDADLAKKVTVFTHNLAINDATNSASKTNWLLIGGIGAAALALAGAGGFMISRRRRAEAEEAALADVQAAPAVDIPTIDLESVSNESQMRKQLESLARKKPEEFVNLLRTWLVDE